MLHGLSLDQPAAVLIEFGGARKPPIVARESDDAARLRTLMIAEGVAQIPILDQKGRVVGLTLLRDVLEATATPAPLHVVVMAGGRGTRLQPLTDTLPKPMLPIGDRPLLEIIVSQLRGCGASHVYITTNYKKDVIIDHFGDGSRFGVPITYVEESTPLGTAGSIASVDARAGPLVVMNGDILTSLDFREIVRFHNEHNADLTIAVRIESFQLPFGVINLSGESVTGFQEKPFVERLVNAGVYVLAPHVANSIPAEFHVDMSELIERVLSEGRRVVAFPIYEYWTDVGRMADYERAQLDVREGKVGKG